MSAESKPYDQVTARRDRRLRRNGWKTVRFRTMKNGPRASVGAAVAVAMLLIGTKFLSSLCLALTTAQRRAIVLSKIRRGMTLSQEAKSNVTAAEEACEVWESVLSRPSVSSPTSSSSIVTPDVIFLSKTLYASCLVRVGRDSEALSVYDSCLDDARIETASAGRDQTTEWRFAKARCFQRLLKYSDAAEEYSRVLGDIQSSKEDGSNNINTNDITSWEHQARFGAATCVLRSSGDIIRALKVLEDAPKVVASSQVFSEIHTDTLLLASCLEYLETGEASHTVDRLQQVFSIVEKLKEGSENDSTVGSSFLLYRWILAALKPTHSQTKAIPEARSNTTTLNPKDIFMELIRINTSPLDDPYLLLLDDKIELHNLLAPAEDCLSKTRDFLSRSTYWPDGFVLPTQSSELREMPIQGHEESQLWIAKSRAGYGSHGNRILTIVEAREETNGMVDGSKKPASKEIEPYLFQRMVDPLMLLQGYKFSLRIYVVYFSADEAYISSKGLVKLASTPLLPEDAKGEKGSEGADAAESDNHSTFVGKTNNFRGDSIHMTNSGRETMMQQEDLDYLWNGLGTDGDREKLWKEICGVAAEVLMTRYPERTASLESGLDPNLRERNRVWKSRREEWSIPKILGLDFVVDATNQKPWLVEVNRFPGLEPRDEEDRKIKYRVVRDAWKKASERLSNPIEGRGERQAFFDDSIFESLSSEFGDDERSSLERLQL